MYSISIASCDLPHIGPPPRKNASSLANVPSLDISGRFTRHRKTQKKISHKSAPSFLHGGAARAPEPRAEIFRAGATAAMGHAIDLADLLPMQGGDQDKDEAGDEEGDACSTSARRGNKRTQKFMDLIILI